VCVCVCVCVCVISRATINLSDNSLKTLKKDYIISMLRDLH